MAGLLQYIQDIHPSGGRRTRPLSIADARGQLASRSTASPKLTSMPGRIWPVL